MFTYFSFVLHIFWNVKIRAHTHPLSIKLPFYSLLMNKVLLQSEGKEQFASWIIPLSVILCVNVALPAGNKTISSGVSDLSGHQATQCCTVHVQCHVRHLLPVKGTWTSAWSKPLFVVLLCWTPIACVLSLARWCTFGYNIAGSSVFRLVVFSTWQADVLLNVFVCNFQRADFVNLQLPDQRKY